MSLTLEQEQSEIVGLEAGRAPSVWRHLRRSPVAVLSLTVLTLLILTAIFGPICSPYKYDRPTSDYSAGPSLRHWMGTDSLGFDTFTLLAMGARVSLGVGVTVELTVLLVGGLVGLLAGYYGRWVDSLLMRLTDLTFAFPDILLAILIMAVWGAGFGDLFIALAVTGWPGMARLIRGQAQSLRRREFVEAARALGLPDRQVILRHVLPNLISPVIVAATVDIAGVIIAESTLSFLGIGVQPLPSWGSMISGPLASQAYRSQPLLVIFPALALALTVLSLNFLGDALRDALDPRQVDLKHS